MDYIYTIECPYSGLVVYVGRTINIKARFKQHLNNSTLIVGIWCKAIISMGKTPKMTILKSGDFGSSDANEIENFYINKYKNIGQANLNRFHNGKPITYANIYSRPLILEIQDMKSIILYKQLFKVGA